MLKKISLTTGTIIMSLFTGYTLVTKMLTPGEVNAATPCVVTIFGVQYNVAPLQAPGGHSGGNIFTCGTDMTSVYQGMHGTNVSRIKPYIYVAATTTPTPTPTARPGPSISPSPTSGPVPTKIEVDDDDDDENYNDDDHDENEKDEKDEVENHDDRRDDRENERDEDD